MRATNEDARNERIARLGRELAEAINEAEGDGREFVLRSAIEELKESVDLTPPSQASMAENEAGRRPLNPMALGIPACLAGAVLVFLFPLVGLALFVGGLTACGVGVVMAIVTSGKRDRAARRAAAEDRGQSRG